jgi:hypothetical protein
MTDEPRTSDGFDIREMPTFEDMLNWKERLVGDWGELDDAQESEENLYFQIFDVESPGGKLAVKTGSAPADTDAVIDTLVPPDISVKVRPLRAKQKYRNQSEKLVRFAKAMLMDWRKRKDVLRLIASDMAIRRVGVWRVMVDASLWPDKPNSLKARGDLPEQMPGEADEAYETRIEAWEESESEEEAWEVRHRRKNPIIFQRRSPRHVRWKEDSDSGEILVVVEHFQTTVLEAQNTLGPVWGEDRVHRACQGFEPLESVDHDEIWFGKHRCVILNDIPISGDEDGTYRGIVQHPYGEIPYVIAPFRELTFDEMERKYRGALTNGAGLYPIESNVLTMQVWMLAINAWRTYLGWTKDGRALEIKPGQYIPIDERIGEYLKMLEGSPVPEELLKTSAVMDSYIQRNSVAQGPRSAEGTRSAQQLWAIQSMRTLKIESGKDALTRGIQRSLELAAMHAETVLKDSLTLPVPGKTHDGEDMGEVTVKPSDIGGYWDGFDVSMGRRLDPALLEQWKALQGLAANKWMPQRVSYEMSGATDNPQEWIDELVREAVDALPFVLEQVGLERIKNWFGEESDRFIQLSQRVTQGGAARPANTQQQPTNPMKGGGGGGAPSDIGTMLAGSMKAKGTGKPAGKPQPAGRQNGRPVG